MEISVRLAEIELDSVVNGPGVRTVLYTQGCKHQCKGCHNPSTWDFKGGKTWKYDEILEKLKKNKLSTGVTWSGGDPVYQSKDVYEINYKLKKLGYNIWLYTGFTFEYLIVKERKLLSTIDILVDGPFELEHKTLELPFVGSSNQRVIDIPFTLKREKIVLWNEK